MAHRKAGGTVKNVGGSQPKYLGVKLGDGARASAGAIIIRQRGTRFFPGRNVGLGKDHSIFARTAGVVRFSRRRRAAFDGRERQVKIVSVI